MMTGDNIRAAQQMQQELGIKKIIAGILPQDKEAEIRKLQIEGKKVAMVGDGINDAPALARADLGINIGAGRDIAIDSADVVLTSNDLSAVTIFFHFSKKVMQNIKQNLFWAFFYNIIGIPLAAGLFYTLWGWTLSPILVVAAMIISSVTVVLNALRIK
jgi:Cu+-exporting ATPase